jgi:NAD(P)-dependent dehydrogenase (short-subunit alcohol dehydrogenase family)
MSGFSMKDRVALVTGGARGIGRAAVQELVRLGARVVIADDGGSIGGESADPQPAQALAAELAGRAVAFTEDISAPGAAQAAVDLARARFGALDAVVNGASVLREGLVFDASRADWDRAIQTTLTGAFATLSAAAPVMRDAVARGRAPGRIVNLVSTAGLYGHVGQAAFAAANAGVVGLTRAAAMDLVPSRIACNAVAPFAAARVTESIRPAGEGQESVRERAPTVPADYAARLVAYLCLPACEFTGQIFGLRGRELFLFSQPRPAARAVTHPLAEITPQSLDALISLELREQFTDLTTDLEAFTSEPML